MVHKVIALPAKYKATLANITYTGLILMRSCGGKKIFRSGALTGRRVLEGEAFVGSDVE
jgi:hypothetical protein